MKSSRTDKKPSLFASYKSAKLFTRWDILLCVLIITALIVCAVFLFGAKTSGNTCNVYIEGKLAATYSLDEDATFELFDGAVVAEIKHGAVAIIENDCKNGICMATGYISEVNEKIICAPHKLVIAIYGDSDVDAVTGGAA